MPSMPQKYIFIVVFILFGVVILLWWNQLYSRVHISLIWIQSPELDVVNLENIKENESSQRVVMGIHSTIRNIKSVKKIDIPSLEKEQFFLVDNQNYKPQSNDNSNKNNYVYSKKLRQPKQCFKATDYEKFDCHPETGATMEACEQRGCCWVPHVTSKKSVHSENGTNTQASVDVPWCYYPSNYPGYQVKERNNTELGFAATLEKSVPGYYPNDINLLNLEVIFETSSRLHIRIYDPSSRRYEVPLEVPHPSERASNPEYDVQLSDMGQPFNLAVKRVQNQDGPTLLNTSGAAAFIFSDQFLQLSYQLPSIYLYGLGEHRDTLLHSMEWTRFTMWAHDQPPVENSNLYGVHPFYLMMEDNGQSHGFFLLNSNAMDVILQPTPAITWRTIGGILDFYMFLGPSPAHVVSQYIEVIGQPFLPPYWSLGFHICRFGYKNVNQTLDVTNRVRQAGIPQDVQWNDIDYAIEMRDFTTDIERFGNQSAMVEDLHNLGMHYVIITDPGISSTQPKGSYAPYDLAIQMDVVIKDLNGTPIVGKVWPGDTIFPDFTSPDAQSYWTTLIKDFHEKVQFDGLWIDMNEISSFVDGSKSGCPYSHLDYPPYTPAVDGGKLSYRTLCASARQNLSYQYDVHNLYGLLESKVTAQALIETRGRRPFVISRSTYASQGRYGGHWTGDNDSSFYDMYKSIAAILNMNLFGIPLVGADICGFRHDTTAQLCQRWHQLGAFYPFSRNHNDKGVERDQDPASFGEAVAASTRKVYLTRYSLLPYLYTLFYKSHTAGETVARPLFFEFPDDVRTYNIDKQFLWGPSLLISPVLEENQTTVEAFFPDDVWYNFYTGVKMSTRGETRLLDAPMDVINLHVRGGYVLPMQEPALTTTESRNNKFSLLVSLDENIMATGDLFWDDGDSLGTVEKGEYNIIYFNTSKNELYSYAEHSGFKEQPMLLGNITIFGMPLKPSVVEVNAVLQNFTFNSQTQVLYVPDLKINLLEPFLMMWR
ncbi:hypothetical protein ACJMK2_033763 [Sinanodonta woodiana]|uniref:P-type domain-containing protein n=1 Tax=Sinanodonta woodiana TaxID=1069815 RepID=A0ABD3WPE2_SINWO